MVKQTAGHEQLGNFAEKFAELNDDILFGEVWSREDKLSLRDRSLVTICVFMGKGLVDSSLKYHILNAKKNGITLSEMAEIVTHAAFYAGWPNAWAVFNIVKEVYADEIKNNNIDRGTTHGGAFGMGEPNVNYAQYFIGNSYLKILDKTESGVTFANVTFEPRCRNNWHIHHSTKGGGQVLICVEGEGWYQEEGKAPQSLKVGDIVAIPANVKHWHGAKNDSWFSHIAVEIPGENTSNEWCEPVSDEEYDRLEKNMRLSDFKEVSDNVNLNEYLELYNYVRDNMEHPEWLGTFTKEEIKEILEAGGKIWLYYDNNIPVCSVFFIPTSNKSLRKHNIDYDESITGSLGPIMVRKDYVGNGLQTAMLDVINNYAESIGMLHMFTKAHSDNIYSIRNILKDGYKIVDEYDNERGHMIAFAK